MLKSYITIALRRLQREKTYVAINIFSLALGIASFVVLAMYLRSELTYDQYHENGDRIYRLVMHFKNASSDESASATSALGFGPLFAQDYPQVGKFVRFQVRNPGAPQVLVYEDKEFYWEKIYLADPAVFEIFTHKAVFGDPKTAFDDPHAIALSQSVARRYFGDENPIGKTMTDKALTFKVALVFEDFPENTHFRYDALISWKVIEEISPNFTKSYDASLFNTAYYTYFLPPPGMGPKQLRELATQFIERRMGERERQLHTTVRADFQPLREIHLGEKLEGDLPTGQVFYVHGFAAAAVFILLVACINYMNLATARAARRAREVGMRKVLGASRLQVAFQFLGESAVFTAIAALLGLLLVALALGATPLGRLMDREHLLADSSNLPMLGFVFLLIAAVAVISGLYPALYLSAATPLEALVAVKRSRIKVFSMRHFLVFVQLCICVAVIASTILMARQMRYVHERPLGFEKENRLLVTLRRYDVLKNMPTIREELRRLPNVIDVSNVMNAPGTGNFVNLVPLETESGTLEPTEIDRIMVGPNFLETMKIPLLEGRTFSKDIATDPQDSIVVNEALVRKMGWTNPLGKRLRRGPDAFFRVIGVAKDFNYSSLHNRVGPLVINAYGDMKPGLDPGINKDILYANVVIALTGTRLGETLAGINKVLSSFDPRFQFEPKFLDERLDEQYRLESHLMELTGVFACICILIAIMGLYGLMAYTIEERTREIGMRRVLGASDSQIFGKLVRPVMLLVLLAAVPASLVSYDAIGRWIARFAYYEPISLWTFGLAVLVVAAVTFTTVLVQTSRALRGEAVEALRYE